MPAHPHSQSRHPEHPGNYPHCRIHNLFEECKREDLFGDVDFCYLTFDIRGYTKVLQIEDKRRDVLNFLRELFGKSCSGITERNGRVNKLIGDALFAIFPIGVKEGSPTLKEAVVNAMRYAFDVLKIYHGIASNKNEIYGHIIGEHGITGLGVSISTGKTYLGLMGGTLQDYTDFSYFGRPINLLFRLSSKANAGQIFIPSELKDHLADTCLVITKGELTLRNFSTPYPISWVVRKKGPGIESHQCCERCDNFAQCEAVKHAILEQKCSTSQTEIETYIQDSNKTLDSTSKRFGHEFSGYWTLHHDAPRPCCPACKNLSPVCSKGEIPNFI